MSAIESGLDFWRFLDKINCLTQSLIDFKTDDRYIGYKVGAASNRFENIAEFNTHSRLYTGCRNEHIIESTAVQPMVVESAKSAQGQPALPGWGGIMLPGNTFDFLHHNIDLDILPMLMLTW